MEPLVSIIVLLIVLVIQFWCIRMLLLGLPKPWPTVLYVLTVLLVLLWTIRHFRIP